ncbi:MAG: hypothetical protein IPM82_19635 [Saprospiraceae bacterium]|nr:hypothetical protein [Saprospiraceae bacterium]
MINIGSEDVNSVEALDLNADGVDDLFAITQGKFYYIDTQNQPILLHQEAGVTYYVHDFLEFEDLDMDGLKDIIYANNYSISASSSICLINLLLGADETLAEPETPFVVYPIPVSDVLYIKPKENTDFISAIIGF